MKSGAGFGVKALLAVAMVAGAGLAFAVGSADGSGTQPVAGQVRSAMGIQSVAAQRAIVQTESDGAPKPWVLLLAGGAVVAWVALRRSAAR